MNLSESSDNVDMNITNSYVTVGTKDLMCKNEDLKEIMIKNINQIIIGTLNINSLFTKFEQLKLIIANYLHILVIGETKLDSSFPDEQFTK